MRYLRAVAPLLAVTLLWGCGYRLAGRSTNLPPHIKKIGIPTFINKTDRPELEQRITVQVINEFVTRGRYTISASEEGMDAVLRGEISRFAQIPVAINAQGRATRYEMVINARTTLIQSSNDVILWQDDHFTFRRQYNVETENEGVVSVETGAIDLVARDFARSVVSSILEGF